MNVPRETINRLRGERTVAPLRVSSGEFRAIEKGVKTAARLLMLPANSVVRPGNWLGVDFDTGRARFHHGTTGVLRARCRMPSGQTRAVSITPKMKPGDLFWLSLKGCCITTIPWCLEVTQVNPARVQDITAAGALNEGVFYFPQYDSEEGPRGWFRSRWDSRHPTRREARWDRNPWVWVVEFRIHGQNVVDFLEGLT